jgi:hypothetical protein
VGSGSGWSGTWESTNLKVSRPGEWDISSYGNGGLSFYVPARKERLNLNFDGKDYQPTGPEVTPGWSSSGQRTDKQQLEVSEKFKGKVVSKTEFRLSSDGRTLTVTEHREGQPNSQVIVYDKM